MIDLYYWPTPNGHKASIMLEETGLAYRTVSVNILKGEQFTPEFLAVNPNNRVPAIVDHDGPGGEPMPSFESGAILLYLAEKSGVLHETDLKQRYIVLQWLMFQMAGVGPMFGQNGYFQGYCPEDVPLAKERYHKEARRLYGVLDKRLAENRYLAGETYSVADVATWPWTHVKQQALHRIDINDFPHVKRWNLEIGERDAVKRGVALMADDQKVGNPNDETYTNLFGDRQYEDHGDDPAG